MKQAAEILVPETDLVAISLKPATFPFIRTLRMPLFPLALYKSL
jgi:hypothetical protein